MVASTNTTFIPGRWAKLANEEWERLKEALRKPATPEARKEAAQRFKEYQQAKKAKGRPRSRPTLVSLGLKKTYPHAIPLDKIPDELERSPEFFELMGRIIK